MNDKIFVKQSVLTLEQIEEIINFGKSFQFKQGAIGTDVGTVNREYRSAEVASIPIHKCLPLCKLLCVITAVVENKYKQPISNYTSNFQFIKYQQGDFYKKHADVTSRKSPKRVLSVIFLLTDENDYEGGDVVFYENNQRMRLGKKQGTLIIFPSTMQHEVTPITQGTRYSLVTWLKDFEVKDNESI